MKLPLVLLTTALLVTAAHAKPTPAPAPSAQVFDLKQVDALPKPIEQPAPVYPPSLRFTNTQGQAVVRFVVDANGTTRDLEVLKTDHADFSTAAVDSVKQWRFKPALKSKQPVHCRMEVPVVFTLTSS